MELYSVAWSRWLPSVHSMFDFAFPVEPRTFPSVPMSVLSCTRALTRLLFFPWTRPSLSTHISGLFESFELGIEIPEPTGLRLQFCRLARNERPGDESSGPRKKRQNDIRSFPERKIKTLRPLPGNAPEAASVLGARPAFWPGQDPRSSQDQPGPPRPTAIKIIIGTGEAILTAIGAPPRARWLPLGRMQRAIPGPLISSRCLAPTRPPGPCTAA